MKTSGSTIRASYRRLKMRREVAAEFYHGLKSGEKVKRNRSMRSNKNWIALSRLRSGTCAFASPGIKRKIRSYLPTCFSMPMMSRAILIVSKKRLIVNSKIFQKPIFTLPKKVFDASYDHSPGMEDIPGRPRVTPKLSFTSVPV